MSVTGPHASSGLDAAAGSRRARSRAALVGLGLTLTLMTLAVLVPVLFGWEVEARYYPPLHSDWEPGIGIGTLPALVVAILAVVWAVPLAERLRWRHLLPAVYVVGLAWMLALAYVDGESGITRTLGNRFEYLITARAVDDVPAMLAEFTSRIPYDADGNWVVHVAGHPPGALLFFVALVRIGLGGDYAAAMVVIALAASTAVAVLCTLRTLGAEHVARRAAPFLALGPAAIWQAVSADAMFAAVAAWGLAALAVAATRRSVAFSVAAGLLLGSCVMLSYGLPLLGLLAVAILVLARTWFPLPIAAAAALVVVLVFAAYGFAWWEAYPVLHDRYWAGFASERPASYWLWGNLAALAFCAGPLLGAALGHLVVRVRGADRVVVALVGAAAVTIAIANASLMSKAEVERIWLPFVPWLLVACALLPERWRRAGLALQLALALVVQHLFYTSW